VAGCSWTVELIPPAEASREQAPKQAADKAKEPATPAAA
jgi:hypothetical protein